MSTSSTGGTRGAPMRSSAKPMSAISGASPTTSPGSSTPSDEPFPLPQKRAERARPHPDNLHRDRSRSSDVDAGDIDVGAAAVVAPNERQERLDDGGYRIDTGNGGCGLRDDGAEPRGGPAPVGQALDVGRQDPARTPRRSGTSGTRAGEELLAGPSGPRGFPGRAGANRASAIHADQAGQGRGAGDDPLRPPDPGAGRGRRGSARVARREQGSL